MIKMKEHFTVVALAISLAFSANVMAQNMSKSDYKISKETISTEYTSAKASCASFSGNAKDICVLEAKGKEKIAKADLEANYQPTVKSHYNAKVARAEANYAVAKERCDDLAGNPKDVCIKEAKAAQVTAKADAKLKMKITDENTKAMDITATAISKAETKKTEARTDATTATVDAQYKVALEKCDAYSSTAKKNCTAQAKVDFAKP